MKLKKYVLTLAICAIGLIFPWVSQAQSYTDLKNDVVDHLSSIYHDGKNELHVPVYTYHFPFGYDRDIYDQLNHWPIGIGFGKGLDQPNGRWSGFYLLTFSDSHHDQQPSVVYSQSWPLVGDKQSNVSIGFVGFITARSDTWNYFPFPGVLPMMSASPSESFKITMTYVPSFTHGTGNVTLFTTTYRF
jgi:palmitoyl transferase